MLRFQLVRPKQLFLLELILLSVLFHCIVLFLFLVVYSGYRYSTKIVVRRSGVQLLPSFFVRTPVQIQQSESAKNQHQLTTQKTISKRIPSTTVKKEEPKKAAQVKKQQQSAQPKKQQPVQKPKPKEKPKKELIQKSSPVKAKPQSKAKPKEEAKQLPPKQHVAQEKSAQAQTLSAHALPQVLPIISQVAVVGDYTDLDTIQIQNYIQKEVCHNWSPPIGLPDDLVCSIKVLVGSDGCVVDAIIQESSGVLVYDLSARSAAVRLSLPCWAWGKEFSISFRHE